MLAVHPDFPANSVADLVALAKKDPGKLNFNGPVGSMSDYLGKVLMSTTGVDMVMVPYKAHPMHRLTCWPDVSNSGSPLPPQHFHSQKAKPG